METNPSQIADRDWVAFRGGELEGRRPRVLCQTCRARLKQAAAGGAALVRPAALCFQCYRADIDRERAIRAAGERQTASDARFQSQLPFEPVNRPRLDALKAERAAARAQASVGVGQFNGRRRQAQMAARRALDAVVGAVRARVTDATDRERAIAAAVHAAELQLPESWIPFVVAR
jgi:hypothetical protein